ncbi:biotin carboxylase [Pseudorhodoferax sp. Leaf267]|nr:biotin carboxylase [Pseudorhodoferax sp. Leaf267]
MVSDVAAPAAAAVRGTAMAYTQGLRGYACEHEQMTRMEVVRRLARLKGGYAVSEEFAQAPALGPVYLVPSDTLVGVERAQALGIRGKEDFFGGVVPFPFVSTKAITHPLVAPDAPAPEGWSHEFSRMVGDAVLPGFTAFSRADALTAAGQLLAVGPVRIKIVRETGGNGQSVARDMAEVQACLAPLDDSMLAADGVVLEQNLRHVDTLSVGQVTVAGIVATYYGYQRLTPNNKGAEVYGGSDLTVVRGDFQALLQLQLPREVRIAVEQALLYDSAATACFPGFFASRINYDVVQGTAADGTWHSAVLEQSWRAGGATGAEIAALEALQADPQRHVVRASGHEIFGSDEAPPPGAVVYFNGVDEQVGRLTKYTTLIHDDHPT